MMKTKKLYYVVNDDTITRVSPLCTNKREVEKVCRDANKRYPHLFLVSWQWDDANGREELDKLPHKPVYVF